MRVLTVCLGNICRSPTAEAAIRAAAERVGLPLEVDSAGIGDWHIGERPDRRMTAAARDAGLELGGRARQVDPDELARHDLVLAMDRAVWGDLRDLAGDDARVELFRTWDPEAPPGAELDVPDPYYGGPEGFAEVVRIVTRTADHLVASLPTH